MAYFTAVLARVGDTWRTRAVEIDDYADLDELTDALRAVAHQDEPVVAVVEHEDEWFALVRVDAEDDPRLFVSDLYAASSSPFGALLAPAAEVEGDPDDSDDAPASSQEDADADADDDEPAAKLMSDVDLWAGESDLLEDLGVSGKQLRTWVDEHTDDPGLVISEIGEIVGFADQLEALR